MGHSPYVPDSDAWFFCSGSPGSRATCDTALRYGDKGSRSKHCTKWYSEKMGLRVVMEAPPRDGAAVAVLEGGDLIVEPVQLDRAMPLNKAAPTATGPQFVHGIFKAGLLVEDFDKTVAALRARGVEIAYGPFPAGNNQRANVIVRDGDGNHIQFIGKYGDGTTTGGSGAPE